MSRTIFNTQRTVKSSGQVASSEYALVTIGGRTELGQSVSGSYTRQIRDLYELGSTTVLWLTGREMGNMTFNRLVGARGFFDGWGGEDCGEITSNDSDVCAECCDHSDRDSYCCLICGKELGEDDCARAYDQWKASRDDSY